MDGCLMSLICVESAQLIDKLALDGESRHLRNL